MNTKKTKDDLAVSLTGGRLNIRVAAIIRRGDAVLVSKWREDISLIGGRVVFGEDTEAAVIREVFEETGLRAHTAHFRAVVENFYTYEAKRCHEYLFIYEMAVDDDNIECTAIDFDKQELFWLEKEKWELLQPSVIRVILQTKHKGIMHFIN